ncbi:MAG: peptide ABC transporter permease [Pseudonocardiales bacterium]|nr:MAG: peptide ABC transporter permease [Pseudonocardiales bacterium]
MSTSTPTPVGRQAPSVATPNQPPEGHSVSRHRLVLRRLVRKRVAMAGVVVLVGLFVFAFVGPSLSQWGYESQDFDAFLAPPSVRHWFGTTQIGQDVYVRAMRGLQKSLVIGLLVAVFSTGVAMVVGGCAGYFGGWVDRMLMWLVDLLLVLPAFLIIAVLSPGLRGRSWLWFVALLAGFSWMITARVVRGLALSLREREFVQAARFIGVPSVMIIFRHLLPNMSSFLITNATINVGGAVLAETGLSYFGFGVQPPDVSLGTLIVEGTPSALTYPWLFHFAAGLLILTVLAVSAVGDGLRDALDPHAGSGMTC